MVCMSMQLIQSNYNVDSNTKSSNYMKIQLTLSVLIETLVTPYKNPLCTSTFCDFGTLPELDLKSHSLVPTWCIKLYVTQSD